MLRLAQYDIARTKQPFPAYLAVGILYFLLIFLSGKGMRMLEKKLRDVYKRQRLDWDRESL